MRYFQHVEADADDERAADGGQFRHGRRVEPLLEAARKQRERPLIDKHGQGREQDPEPVGRGHRQRGEAVDDGLGKNHGAVAPQALVERADDRHRADAEQHRGVDHAVGEQRVGRFEPLFQPVAHTDEAGFQPEQFADHGADDDAENDDERILRGQGHLEADDEHAQAESLKDDGADAFRQTGTEGQPHEAAQRDARRVDDGSDGDHACSP